MPPLDYSRWQLRCPVCRRLNRVTLTARCERLILICGGCDALLEFAADEELGELALVMLSYDDIGALLCDARFDYAGLRAAGSISLEVPDDDRE